MDPALQARLAPFRLERGYNLLVWGVRWTIVMTVAGVLYGLFLLPLLQSAALPKEVPAVMAWWPVWGNMLIALIWTGLGVRGLVRFHLRRLRYRPFARVLGATLAMVRKDLLNTEIRL